MHRSFLLLLTALSLATAQLPAITDFLSDPFRPADTMALLSMISAAPRLGGAAWLKTDCAIPIVDVSYPESLMVTAVRTEAGGLVAMPWGSVALDISNLREACACRFRSAVNGIALRGNAAFVNDYDRATVTCSTPVVMDGLLFGASLTPGIRSDELNCAEAGDHCTLGAAAAVRFEKPFFSVSLGGEKTYDDDDYRMTLVESESGGLTGSDTLENFVATEYRTLVALERYEAIARIQITPAVEAGADLNWREYATDYAYPLADRLGFSGNGGEGSIYSTFALFEALASTIRLSLERMLFTFSSDYERSNGSYSMLSAGAELRDRTVGIGLDQQVFAARLWSLLLYTGYRDQQLICPQFTADPVKYELISFGDYTPQGSAAAQSFTAGVAHTARVHCWTFNNRLGYLRHDVQGSFSAANTWTGDVYRDTGRRIIHALSLESRETLELGPWSLSGFLNQGVPFAIVNPSAPAASGGGGSTAGGAHHVLFGLFHAGVKAEYSFGGRT
jgi:hypothetical protein